MKKILMAAVALLVMTASTTKKPTTIFIIGDSTAAKKDLSKGSPERGWGMALQCYFDEAFIRVDNHAQNGRSSKDFIDRGLWQKVYEKIQPGDYVIIQFGHNDEKKKDASRYTIPGSTFDANLAKYVNETRERGGIPILMNAVVRRNFTSKGVKGGDDEALRNTTFKDGGKTKEGNELKDSHGRYATQPRVVADSLHVLFVDANKITHDLEQSLGVEESKKLHMWYKPGEHPALPDGRQDNTHYNIYGAHRVAGLLADALCQEIPLLTKYRTNDDPCKMEQPK